MRKIYVESEDGKTSKEYSIPRGVHINVQEGEHVKAGEALIDGPSNLHDLLAVLGENSRRLSRQRHSRGLPPPGRQHQ